MCDYDEESVERARVWQCNLVPMRGDFRRKVVQFAEMSVVVAFGADVVSSVKELRSAASIARRSVSSSSDSVGVAV
jgi:hypothetical protein